MYGLYILIFFSFCADDDNDIELALAVSRAYLPSITSESMREMVNIYPDHFTVSKAKSVFGTEEILNALLTDAVS